MADEQNVFISGISGSIQQWSTEATATKIEGTLKKIASQNTSIIQLLNAVKGGGSLSAKELNKVGAELRQTKDKIVSGNKKEEILEAQTRGEVSKHTNYWKRLITGQDRQFGETIKQSQEDARYKKQMIMLMNQGMSQQEATDTLEAEKTKKQYDKAMATVIASAGSIAAVTEAVQVGFEQRFNMAEELRTSGLLDGIDGVNQGFISIAKTIAETGFTFGQAAEFTSKFSKTVGVLGVKRVLDFTNSMARDPGGLMDQFAIEFGQVAEISGEYLDSLRISGQLSGRSDQQLRKGMDSFMSNVQATSNVLKISMEDAATLLKNSLGDSEKGMLLLLDKATQDSVRSAMQMMGGVDNPLTNLLSARIGAGSDQMFQLTSQFQDSSQTPLGMEMIKFVNEAAAQLSAGGDSQFQSFMATSMPDFVSKQLEFFSGDAAKGLAISDERMLAQLAQMNELAQNMSQIAKGISAGDREDSAVVKFRDAQLQAANAMERAMNETMPGFTTNMELMTETNRKFAEQAADTITANANLIDSIANVGTSIDRTMSWFGRQVLAVGEWVGGVSSTFPQLGQDNNIMTASDFTDIQAGSSGRVKNKESIGNFNAMANALVTELIANKETLTQNQLNSQMGQFEQVVNTLLKTQAANPDNRTNLDDSIRATQEKVLSQLNSLLEELKSS